MHCASTIRTLAAIGLLAATRGPAQSQTRSPEGVFARFCNLDAQGAQLTAAGWQEIAALFTNPGPPRRHRIIVTDGGGPLRPASEGERISIGRAFIQFGQIELPEIRFSAVDGLPPGVKIVDGFMHLVKVPGPDGEATWRIEGPVPEPHLSVNSAIRYVSELRVNTKDAAISRNADRTLAVLKHFQ